MIMHKLGLQRLAYSFGLLSQATRLPPLAWPPGAGTGLGDARWQNE